MSKKFVFNPPPGWPAPPPGWQPPNGWTPDPSWPQPPAGWQLWVQDTSDQGTETANEEAVPEPMDNIGAHASAEDSRIASLKAEVAVLRMRLEAVAGGDEVVLLDDDRVLQDVGIYRYHHPLENAVAYRERLSELGGRIAELVRSGGAIEKSNMFTFDNSLAKGRRMTNDLAKLMLRAYNAEADNAIRSLRLGNVVTAKKRLDASREAIAKLGKMMEMRISDDFQALRVEEIELTADWLMKKRRSSRTAA